MERVPFYGGPEEGGWYGSDVLLVQTAEVANESLANKLSAAIQDLAKQLSIEARREDDLHMSLVLDAADAAGIDYENLPEPDGASSFFVIVTNELPMTKKGLRNYE